MSTLSWSWRLLSSAVLGSIIWYKWQKAQEEQRVYSANELQNMIEPEIDAVLQVPHMASIVWSYVGLPELHSIVATQSALNNYCGCYDCRSETAELIVYQEHCTVVCNVVHRSNKHSRFTIEMSAGRILTVDHVVDCFYDHMKECDENNVIFRWLMVTFNGYSNAQAPVLTFNLNVYK